jgi:tetratricopeptide (TPR) repeat protein
MLGAALVWQSRWCDAAAVYEEMRAGLADNAGLLRTLAHGDVNWSLALIKSGRAPEAMAILEPQVKLSAEQLGNDNYQTAERRGFLALALMETGQRQRALAEFQDAVRVLIARGKVSGEEREASPGRARRLVTQLFERYAGSDITRAQALREAHLAVMEEHATDSTGKPLFSYAHPLFWAPYALVGDGGR